MKSIIFCIPYKYGVFTVTIIVILVCIISSINCSPPSCGLYGSPPCQFLPAPPGQTPSCARPGKTYCEHIENYPIYLIKHLIHKWGYEAKNLIVDETWDDFAAVAWHKTPVFYDPAFIFPQRHNRYGNNGVPGNLASGGHHDFGGYDYDNPTQQHRGTEPPTFLFYSSAGQRLNGNNNNNIFNSRKTTPNNPTFWLKRIARDLGEQHQQQQQQQTLAPTSSSTFGSNSNHTNLYGAETRTETPTTAITSEKTPISGSTSSRDVSLNMDLLDILGVDATPRKVRVRRQSPGRTSLCQTTSQFVAPQAALNNKGNWMFVVNAPSVSQLVKAELCASNTCSNICQLPSGYNSRCEQKFVQKRLIALQANGQNLYTDTFWFPSCCVCTISAN